MKKFYTVDLMVGNELYYKNAFSGTLKACIEYITTNEYNTDNARICEYTNDGGDIIATI